MLKRPLMRLGLLFNAVGIFFNAVGIIFMRRGLQKDNPNAVRIGEF